MRKGQGNMNTNNITHAIAYMDTFMRCDGIDGSAEMEMITQNIYSLSSQAIVNIVRDSVKRSNVYGTHIIIREMETDEFHQYVKKKIEQLCDVLMCC